MPDTDRPTPELDPVVQRLVSVEVELALARRVIADLQRELKQRQQPQPERVYRWVCVGCDSAFDRPLPPPPNPLCACCRADVQARRSQTTTLADELAKEQAKAKPPPPPTFLPVVKPADPTLAETVLRVVRDARKPVRVAHIFAGAKGIRQTTLGSIEQAVKKLVRDKRLRVVERGLFALPDSKRAA
jgi:hypothetical protein